MKAPTGNSPHSMFSRVTAKDFGSYHEVLIRMLPGSFFQGPDSLEMPDWGIHVIGMGWWWTGKKASQLEVDASHRTLRRTTS